MDGESEKEKERKGTENIKKTESVGAESQQLHCSYRQIILRLDLRHFITFSLRTTKQPL